MVQIHSRKILLVQVRFGFIDLKFNCRYSFRPEKKEKLLILLELDRLSDDITMHIVWFLLQIVVDINGKFKSMVKYTQLQTTTVG